MVAFPTAYATMAPRELVPSTVWAIVVQVFPFSTGLRYIGASTPTAIVRIPTPVSARIKVKFGIYNLAIPKFFSIVVSYDSL